MKLIDVDEFLRNVVKSGFGAEFINKVTALLIDTPTIESKQDKWIPCSDRLPKASITEPCLMTIIFPRAQAVETAYGYRHHEDVWEYATFEGYEYTERGIAEVVAWMPLPKSWKGANNE